MAFLVDKAKEKLTELQAEKDELLFKLRNQANEFAAEKERLLHEFAEEKRNMVIRGVVEKFNGIFEFLMASVLIVIKEKVDDPYMPRFVKEWVDAILDALWPGIKSEVRSELLEGITSDDPRIGHGEKPCCTSPRAWLRYILYPYDRNIWRKIRHPVWWLCALVSIVPYYAISQFYYVLIFFLIDLRDQFQLESYITEFKCFQFASLGLVSAIVGSVQYYVCVTREPSTCDTVAPRIEIFIMAAFALQIIFAWTAFLLLFCSQKKGGIYYQRARVESDLASREQRREGFLGALRGDTLDHLASGYEALDLQAERDCRRRLMYLLIYDLVIFLICVGLGLWATWKNFLAEDATVTGNEDGARRGNWKYYSTLFWIRAMYGLLSFPFLVLYIPGASMLFSRAKPTGYNPYGNTVPYLGREEEGPVPWDPSRRFPDPDKQARWEQQQQQQRTREPTAHPAGSVAVPMQALTPRRAPPASPRQPPTAQQPNPATAPPYGGGGMRA